MLIILILYPHQEENEEHKTVGPRSGPSHTPTSGRDLSKGGTPNKLARRFNTAFRLPSDATQEAFGPHFIRALIALLRTGSMALLLAFG